MYIPRGGLMATMESLSAFGRAAEEVEADVVDAAIVAATLGDTGCCCTILGAAGTISTGAGCLSNEDKMAAGEAFFFASSSSALLRFHTSKRSLRCRIFSSSLITAGGGVGCFIYFSIRVVYITRAQ